MYVAYSKVAGNFTESLAAVWSRYLHTYPFTTKKDSMWGLLHVDDGVSNIEVGCLLIGACLVDIIIPLRGCGSCWGLSQSDSLKIVIMHHLLCVFTKCLLRYVDLDSAWKIIRVLKRALLRFVMLTGLFGITTITEREGRRANMREVSVESGGQMTKRLKRTSLRAKRWGTEMQWC